MKKILAAIAIAGMAGLTACAPVADTPVRSAEPQTPSGSTAATPSESASAGTADVKESCELFNSLYAEYAAVEASDANAYEDIYLRSQEAKEAAGGDVSGFFAALSLLAIDHSSVAESSGQPDQESKDALRDAVFANAGACTAEGVTLKL